jgi:hypothetical protein
MGQYLRPKHVQHYLRGATPWMHNLSCRTVHTPNSTPVGSEGMPMHRSYQEQCQGMHDALKSQDTAASQPAWTGLQRAHTNAVTRPEWGVARRQARQDCDGSPQAQCCDATHQALFLSRGPPRISVSHKRAGAGTRLGVHDAGAARACQHDGWILLTMASHITNLWSHKTPRHKHSSDTCWVLTSDCTALVATFRCWWFWPYVIPRHAHTQPCSS